MKFKIYMTATLAVVGLTFSGCATTGFQVPPEGAKIVVFGTPENWN